MKRIALLSILFAALIEFAIERAWFDLWIVTVAMVALLWKVAGQTLRAGLAWSDIHSSSFSLVHLIKRKL